MATVATHGGHAAGLMKTTRSDNWWVGPLLTALGLGFFVLYATWAGMQGSYYWYAGDAHPVVGYEDAPEHAPHGFGGYLSPMYSPVLISNALLKNEDGTPMYHGTAPADHAWFGTEWPSFYPGWQMSWLFPFSPAILILVFPGAFRVTCYYYRKAYYRAFFATPPGCGVGALAQKKYRGETRLLLFQNLHRYALYFALAFLVILAYDAVQGFFRNGQFGVGVGSIVLTINVALLTSYTFGCHSFRHLVGGRSNCFSCVSGQIQHAAWKKSSWFNKRHQLFAWCSLFWVGFTDFYVRMVSMGVFTDVSTWG